MKVLIVDDSGEKIREVRSVILEYPDIESEVAMDIQNASKFMINEKFDLLILDVNLPNRVGEEPISGNGRLFLEKIMKGRSYIKPVNIIGLTEYDSELSDSSTSFNSYFSELIHFNLSSEEWKKNLRAKLDNMVGGQVGIEYVKKNYMNDYAIITALKTPELDAFLELCEDVKSIEVKGDPTFYYEAIFGGKKIILATDDTMGMVASTHLSEKVIQTFRPKVILMGGIAAGIENRANFGDILVATTSWNYDSGKHISTELGSEFLPDFQQISIDVNMLRSLKMDISEELFKIKRKIKTANVLTDLAVVLGPVASGSAVISDSDLTERVRSTSRKLIGLEMEIYGMYYAASRTSEPRPKFLAAKSVCDFADSKKSDDYQSYASKTSASYIEYLVRKNMLL